MQPRRSARPSFLLVAVAASAHVVRAQWQGADFVCPRNLSNEPDSPRKFTTPYRYTHQWTKMWLDERSDKACGVMNTHLYTTMISDTSVSPTCTRYCQSCEPGYCSKWAQCYAPGDALTAKCRECLNPPECHMGLYVQGKAHEDLERWHEEQREKKAEMGESSRQLPEVLLLLGIVALQLSGR
eukprot:TRINITY_DN12486_c0_g1_i1.p1 TRINITY_DN12486_c0_g1~~TRINITY_DN12486_c0_g1_i1.p1  ORF type:complete len:183 (-),score=30.53 TRINITY_DN12486_c0_g1_i1:204-752(-)